MAPRATPWSEKCVRKSTYEKELLLVRMGVRKITFFIKGCLKSKLYGAIEKKSSKPVELAVLV
jgi:hypothetical protein